MLNSNGTMTVTSPFSKQVNGSCVKNGTGALPTNGVVYVQSVPSATTDPNYTAGCPYSNPSHPLPTTPRDERRQHRISVGTVTCSCRDS